MSTLQSSKLRVDRAQKKLTELEDAIQSARKVAFKMAAEQADLKAPDSLFEFAAQLRDEARLLISEFALHARTALDYIVFALAWRDTGSEQKDTQFPINESPGKFARNRKPGRCLEHLTDEHVRTSNRTRAFVGKP